MNSSRPLRIGGARGLVMAGGAVKYLLRDLFLDTRAAGALLTTPSVPGPGTRTGTDTSGLLSSANRLSDVGTTFAAQDPKLYIGTVTRAAGICGLFRFKGNLDATPAFLETPRIGFHAAGFATSHILRCVRDTTLPYDPAYLTPGNADPTMYQLNSNWMLNLFIRLRATGAAYYIDEGLGHLQLILVNNTYSDASLNVGLRTEVTTTATDTRVAEIAVYEKKWVQLAIVSDSFNRADGVPGNTDGAGCEESGGSGVAWTDTLGASAISANALVFSALDGGGDGITVVETGTPYIYIQAKLTRSAGNIGLVFAYTDINNYCRVYHDGTNVKLDVVCAGAVTNILTVAKAYAAGAYLAIWVDELNCCIAYNYSSVSYRGTNFAYNTDLPLGATKAGIYSTNTGNSVDNLSIFSGRVVPTFPLTPRKVVNCFGDSLTELLMSHTGQLRTFLGDAWTTRMNGVGGQTTAQGLTRFTRCVLNYPDPYVVIQMGVNDAKAGVASATIEANLQSMYTQAKAAGKTVIAVNLYPCKGCAGYSAAVQTKIDDVNAWIAATATDCDYKVDMYSLLEDPATPDTLLPAYDDGSHLHLTQTGYTLVAQTIYSAVTWS